MRSPFKKIIFIVLVSFLNSSITPCYLHAGESNIPTIIDSTSETGTPEFIAIEMDDIQRRSDSPDSTPLTASPISLGEIESLQDQVTSNLKDIIRLSNPEDLSLWQKPSDFLSHYVTANPELFSESCPPTCLQNWEKIEKLTSYVYQKLVRKSGQLALTDQSLSALPLTDPELQILEKIFQSAMEVELAEQTSSTIGNLQRELTQIRNLKFSYLGPEPRSIRTTGEILLLLIISITIAANLLPSQIRPVAADVWVGLTLLTVANHAYPSCYRGTSKLFFNLKKSYKISQKEKQLRLEGAHLQKQQPDLEARTLVRQELLTEFTQFQEECGLQNFESIIQKAAQVYAHGQKKALP